MLGGPVGASDYFDPSLRGTTFPSGVTPNESSLRTGLTPGGGGSMFPAPSPNSQALYQSMASGGATPSTLDFHRTAMNAAAASKGNTYRPNGTSAQDDKRAPVAPMDPLLQQQVPQATFGQHDNDAANGLFMLAQAGTGSQSNNQFAVPSAQNAPSNQGRANETSPNMGQGLRNGSMGVSAQGGGDASDDGDNGKPTTRSRGKRTSTGKTAGASNGRRKADETPAKQPSAKKAKSNTAQMDMDEMDSDEEQQDIKEEQYHADGKKMTDEEKRRNFLERNRSALPFHAARLSRVTNILSGSPHSNAVSAKSNGSRTSKRRLRSLAARTTICPPRSQLSARKSSASRLCFFSTKTAQFLRARALVATSNLNKTSILTPILTEWVCKTANRL